MITILLIVRNASVRQFVRDTLQMHPDFHITGTDDSLETFLAEPISGEPPQVVLLDNGLHTAGLRRLKDLKSRMPQSDIILFTFANKSEDIYNAYCAGASGHILQSDPVENMISNIRNIREGDMTVLPSIAQKILDTHFTSREYNLSAAEVRLMQANVEGHALTYIHESLHIPVHMVRLQIRSIFRKLHKSNYTTTAPN